MTRLYLYGPMNGVPAGYPFAAQTLSIWTFPDPGNWNPSNHLIECVAPGQTGQSSSFGPPEGTTWGASSNGGNYAYGSLPTLTFPVPVEMVGSTSPGLTGAICCFNRNQNVSNPAARPAVQAGDGGSSLSVGGSSPYFAPAGYMGGGGGGGGESGTSPGGPGGGAAGPHGAGQSATNPTTPGAGDAGHTPIPPTAADGTNGTQWDNIHGCGSGGWQGSATVNAFSGGYFGGGSGGTNSMSGRSSGVGGRGMIVITYTPLPKPQGQAQILA